jgi:acetyl esterase/lipase
VDSAQIYFGGHSVGGTLALLVAAMEKNPFRAVISFGPAHGVIVYGQEYLPFDMKNPTELVLRSPMVFLDNIKTDTWVIEGTGGNIESLRLMKDKCTNPKVRFIEADGSHFSVLAPLNEMVAKRIMAVAEDSKTAFDIKKSEVDTAMKSR